MRSPGRRLYLNRAKDKVLEEGDPQAAFLLVGAGGEVPAEYVGLVRDYEKSREQPKAEAQDEPKAEAKQADEPESKERAKAENKAKQ